MSLTLDYNGDNDGDFALHLLKALAGWTLDVTIVHPSGTEETFEMVEATVYDNEEVIRFYCDPDNEGACDHYIATIDPRILPITRITVL